ncbi:hypothetical protein QGM60_00010 [Winogradskyella sp. SYSU M77433]|nr:hypothetical protein [Winogradskyella sp. SYSU M77433]
MKSIHIIFLIAILIVGCSKNDKKQSTIDKLNETPETLEGTESRILSTYRYDGNIIDNLYKEALSKNQKLEELNDRIEEISSDSLTEKTKEYLKYRNINKRYWSTAKSYANNLNDSIWKIEMIDIIEKLESSYEKKVSKHESKMDSIEELKSTLRDKLILMKLFITEPMIHNYQSNELPDIIQLESIIKDYKKAIEDSKEYTKINK